MADPDSDYDAFVEPGNVVTRRVGKRPSPVTSLAPPRRACPRCRPTTWCGPTAVASAWSTSASGPANAKTITDHIAVLRPHAWLMLGHCAGLRNSQQLGDYVLAHAYMREDHVLDEDLPLWVPIPGAGRGAGGAGTGGGRDHAA
jgi:AMP nucleosidase